MTKECFAPPVDCRVPGKSRLQLRLGPVFGSERFLASPEVTPFWSYFLVGGQPPRTLEFAFKMLD